MNDSFEDDSHYWRFAKFLFGGLAVFFAVGAGLGYAFAKLV